ncbi:MAG: glycerol-3-phosphate 1-O-acyltransferase PlsY [Phenylobacterium sp.]|uniref:glycerol-3-phosphate 1-O-acyltransferase PlsY n=1 Tax=Phenylobacterium sp. TaxID=1871053 RepID=UPI00391D5D70
MFENLTQLQLAVALGGGYLLGSIPFGVIATKLGGAGDVRNIGSGNIGATNVLRTGRKDLALITLLGDGGKGALAVFLAWWFTRDAGEAAQAVLTSLAGGAAFLGHIFPVWLGFKGGRGVATFFGTLLAAAWPVGILAGLAWIAFAVIFRISSLAALAAAALAPVFVFMTDRPHPIAVLAVFMAVLIYIRHIDNIRRLLKGEEPRIGDKKKEPAPDPAA